MSWDQYTDNLMKQGHFDAVAICGIRGGMWAKSPASFNVSDQEILAIVAGIKNPSTAQTNGIRVNGVKYMFVRSDPKIGFMYGAKGKAGVACAKAKTCVIIGRHGENQQSGNATNSVTKMAEYLAGAGY